MRRRRDDEKLDRELAELAALADGSLSGERRAAAEARVDDSAELAALLAEQERAVSLTRSVGATVEAPASLRARLDAREPARRSAPTRRLVVIGALATAVAAAVIGVSVLGSGTGSERFKAALGPTALEPGARGEATLTRTSSGWRINFDATGLPRLADGRFYQAWLRNRAGVLVPIGTFNEGRNVTLWAGVSPVQFPTFSVTRERADGDQRSSGDKVLVGTVETGSG